MGIGPCVPDPFDPDPCDPDPPSAVCLTQGTIIDTPSGPVSVEQLETGMEVWTVDNSGERVTASVDEITMTPVPLSHQVLQIRLDDGRNVTASLDHPTAEGKLLRDYQVGDRLDGGLVVEVKSKVYEGGATYDFLPSGTTGLYWANRVLLKSTLIDD